MLLKNRISKTLDMRSRKKTVGFYHCPYILRNGKVCNLGCYRPEGCTVHWDSPIKVPCKEPGCSELTRSDYGACRTHASKYRSQDHYQRKKLEKMARDTSEVKES